MRWHTRDGRVLDVEDMETVHITNALKQVLRRIENCNDDMGSCYGHGFPEESMAAYYAEGEGDASWEKLEHLCMVRDVFSEELRKREVSEAVELDRI